MGLDYASAWDLYGPTYITRNPSKSYTVTCSTLGVGCIESIVTFLKSCVSGCSARCRIELLGVSVYIHEPHKDPTH